MNTSMQYSTLYCNNCGYEGHLYRNCKHPVMSYGVIIFTNENKILMIQRKDSIAFIEFLRGKYEVSNQRYIVELFNGFSKTEKELVVSLTFDGLWNKLWLSDNTSKPQTERMIKEYTISKKKFNTLSVKDIINKCTLNHETPEWEFPKGRRSNRETNIKCAIREFEEETDLQSSEYMLLENVLPISEEYMGSNGVRYKHIYYYAIYTGKRDLSINLQKKEQYTEIGDLQWLTIKECYSKIRQGHDTKKDIIQKVDIFMNTWKKDLVLKE